MNLVVRDPFRSEFGAISTLFDNVLDFPKEHGNMFVHNWNPAIDIYDSGNEVVIQAELPGIKKEDINIRVENNLLILSGKKERKQKLTRTATTAQNEVMVLLPDPTEFQALSIQQKSMRNSETEFSLFRCQSLKKRSHVK